jgi:hypothetical protein
VGTHDVPNCYEALDRLIAVGFNHLPPHVAFGKPKAVSAAKRNLGG